MHMPALQNKNKVDVKGPKWWLTHTVLSEWCLGMDGYEQLEVPGS